MAAAIDHPSILPIYEAGEFEGQPFLVMRHVPGTGPQDADRAQGPARAARGRSRSRTTSASRSTPRTAAASSTATSSRPTSSSARRPTTRGRVPHRLRAHQGPLRRAPDADRQVGRHGRLHGARADRGQGRRRARRPVRARLRALRGAHGLRAVPARQRRADHVGAHPRRPAEGRARCGRSSGRPSTTSSRAAMAKEPDGALRDLPRVRARRVRGRRRARRRCGARDRPAAARSPAAPSSAAPPRAAAGRSSAATCRRRAGAPRRRRSSPPQRRRRPRLAAAQARADRRAAPSC